MKCNGCKYYISGFQYNACNLIGMEYFKEMNDCDLVNDDMTINYKSCYFDGMVDKPKVEENI